MGKRILVADDSLTIQKAFAMVLSGQDYTLVAARSADEALAAAKGGRPDLVIADTVLGSGNGYDLCASLKADPALRGVPVHILFSSQNPLDEARARRVGADGHLLKPFDSQTLLDSVSAALVAPVRPAPAPAAEAAAVAASRPAPVAPSSSVVRNIVMDEVSTSEDDDSYGEFTIERGSEPGPAPWASRPPTWPGARPAPAAAAPPPGLAPASRPSLIPGVAAPPPPLASRPAPALPGVTAAPAVAVPPRHTPSRTMMGFPSMGAPASAPPAPAAPPVPARPAVLRPAAAPPVPPRAAPPVAVQPAPPVAPAPPAAVAPQAPARRSASMPAIATPDVPGAPVAVSPPAPPVRRSASMPVAAPPGSPAPLVAAVSSVIDQKVAAIAARGREYEAIAKLSREIIEQVVWEVVPELAELIIRQEIDRLAAGKK